MARSPPAGVAVGGVPGAGGGGAGLDSTPCHQADLPGSPCPTETHCDLVTIDIRGTRLPQKFEALKALPHAPAVDSCVIPQTRLPDAASEAFAAPRYTPFDLDSRPDVARGGVLPDRGPTAP